MGISRRTWLKTTALTATGMVLSCNSQDLQQGRLASGSMAKQHFTMPDEGAPHVRTWLGYVANDYIWSRRQIPEVKRNLIALAQAIAGYEPVSMLVSPSDLPEAQKTLGDPTQYSFPIDLIPWEMDDLWLRDTAPTFVFDDQGNKYGINFNFNGWGNKQDFQRDATVADFITTQVQAQAIATSLVLEGGSIEVDGQGTAIMTKSSILNDNRNPHLDQSAIEQELKRLLGLEKIIWLEGIKGKDITDAHIDFYVRFARPGEILVSRDNDSSSYDFAVTRHNIDTLKHMTDAQGNPFKMTIIDTPEIINETFGVRDFAAGYLGYYLCNGAVIMQKFGDKNADQHAKEILTAAFPDRTVLQLAIDGIASGGGSIHCATQQEPMMNP